ncbi:MAG: hypothetical protein ACR2N5_00920 [Solirubrobacterales bacterium]
MAYALIGLLFVLLLVLFGCAGPQPCLSSVTTYVDGGVSRSTGRYGEEHFLAGRTRGKGRDFRAGVSLTFDATGIVCEQPYYEEDAGPATREATL